MQRSAWGHDAAKAWGLVAPALLQGRARFNLWVGEPSGRQLQLPGLRIAVTLQRIAGLRSAVPLQRRGSGAKPVTRVRR